MQIKPSINKSNRRATKETQQQQYQRHSEYVIQTCLLFACRTSRLHYREQRRTRDGSSADKRISDVYRSVLIYFLPLLIKRILVFSFLKMERFDILFLQLRLDVSVDIGVISHRNIFSFILLIYFDILILVMTR